MSPTFGNVKYALALHHVSIRLRDGVFEVSLMEAPDYVYSTDDLEDAHLTGMAMRIRQATRRAA